MAREEKVDPTTPLYFGADDRKGAPTPVIYSFEEAYSTLYGEANKYGGYDKHPLYLQLTKLHFNNISKLQYEGGPIIPRDNQSQPTPAGISGTERMESQSCPAASSGEEPKPTASTTEQRPSLDTSATGPNGIPTLNPNPNPLGLSLLPSTLSQEPAPLVLVKDPKDDKKPQGKDSDALRDSKEPKEGQEQKEQKEENKEYREEEDISCNKQKKCDEAFAAYLDSVARDTNKSCYKQVLKFVFLFRECLNYFGDRLKASKQVQGVVPPSLPEAQSVEYCLTNTAEQAPEVSNEFVTMYLEERNQSFDKFSPVDLTQNFCSWLFNHGFTCSKLSLINEGA